ncbi:MAG: electron transfer flavoprotein subunit beta/FixA family protein [Candidatus Kapabacteria bacterium]|nr:electron transfer flavoprotein subunit beta/FixA family protein [Candidatus Kapabacteria bacterium]
MNILVCISQVPDTTTKVAVGPDGTSMNPAGVKFILNPYDEFAIEEGLRQREKHGGTVTAVSVGPDSVKEVLRTALAMGVDSAVHVKDDHRADSFVVASSIADLVKETSPDVVIFGRQSIDFDSFQLPSMVAELLGWADVPMVSTLSIDGSNLTAESDIEGGKYAVTCALPCVISAQKGLNDPRYPKLPDIMKAKSKPIAERGATAASARTATISMTLPVTKRLNKVLGDSDADLQELVRLLHEEAKVI